MTEIVIAGDAETRAWIGADTVRVLERRDPTAATLPSGYSGPQQAMTPEWNAEQAIRLAYYANVFAYAAVRAIATDLSALPFRVGDPLTNEYDPSHPMAVHFSPPPKGPNPVTSARKLLAWSIAQRIVTGRIGWEIETGAGDRPIAYWPLTSRYLEAFPSKGGARYFGSFKYGPPNDRRNLPADRVFYDWNPSADDWRQPESAFQAARLDLSVAVRQDIYDDAFLKNNAQPASLVVHQRFAKIDERSAFREQFESRFQGERNAGRTAFVEGEGDGSLADAIHIEALGLSQRDGEFIARYDQKIRGILVALGVPMSRLGDATGRTFSNAGQEWTNYWTGTLLPIAYDFADAMNIQLLERYGGRAKGVGYFDVTGVAALQEAAAFQQVGLPALVDSGVLTRDEARAKFGVGPMDDAEIGGSTGPLPTNPTTTVTVNGGTLAAPAVEDRVAVDQEVRRTNLYRSAAASIAILEKRFERAFETMFQAQARATIARLEGKRGRQMRAPDAGAVFDPAFWAASTEEIASGLYESVFAIGGARLGDKFGIDFGLDSPGVNEAIERRSKQLAGQVTDTTYAQIQSALAAGTDAGEAIPELAVRVQGVFAHASDTRATRIARTEVVSAYNAAGNVVAGILGPDVVAGQEWIAARDSRTRADHAEADGQIVGIEESFSVGGEDLAYPGDENGSAANVVNCRCTSAFLSPDEMESV